MKPLSSSLIRLAMPWNKANSQLLQAEAKACFNGDDKTVSLISLISVGGIECQDLPMSGNLKETTCLKTSPYLKYLLACIASPLGRACLYKPLDNEIAASPLYQNNAYPLFYQTLCLPLDNNISLIIEIKCLSRSSNELYDNQQLGRVNTESISQLAKQALNLAKPQLDILQPDQIDFYLGKALIICKKYQKQKGFEQPCEDFIDRWRSLYSVFKNDYDGEWSYQSALNDFRQNALPLMRNGLLHMTDDDRQSVENILQTVNTQLHIIPAPPQRINRKLISKSRLRKQIPFDHMLESNIFDRPIFIVSAPRAGSTLLFETLSQFPQIWSTGEENHASLENIKGLHPKDCDFGSNRLDENDANETVSLAVRKAFISKLHNREQQYFLDQAKNKHSDTVRFLEKTPKNALRIPFLKTLFPDALFIYLHRDYKSNVSSLIDGWRSHQFIAYKDIPGFKTRHWKFLLVSQWQTFHNQSVPYIAKQQWEQCNLTIQQDLSKLPKSSWMSLDYKDLISKPETVARKFADFADLDWDDVIQARCENGLPVSRLTLSSPQVNKWEKHQCFLTDG